MSDESTSLSGSTFEEMRQLVYGLFRAQAVYVAASLGIADLLRDGACSVDHLAGETKTHPRSLRRLLRFLAGEGIFALDAADNVTLTPQAELLLDDHSPSIRKMAINYGSPYSWSAWGHLLESVRTGKTAFVLAHGMPLFQYLGEHPEDAERFNAFMAEIPDLREAAASYDFQDVHLVVDVGGGEGASLIAILRRHPNTRGILFDLPSVAAAGEDRFAAAGLSDRCDVQAGDFFDSVPVGGDVYLLSNILHDWEDQEALIILTNCRQAMSNDGKLLVVEGIIPEGNQRSNAKILDLQMMVTVGGLQRTEREFSALFEQAGFQLTNIIPAGTLSMIEARPI